MPGTGRDKSELADKCKKPNISATKAELQKAKVKLFVAQLCLTLCDPMDCSLPGFSVHRIFQTRILEWVAISFSEGSSQPRDQTGVSFTASRFFAI